MKGQELTLETIVIIVLALVILFFALLLFKVASFDLKDAVTEISVREAKQSLIKHFTK